MGYFSFSLNNKEVSTAVEKIILQNVRETKSIYYLVQRPETLGCCFDNLTSALFSLSWAIFQFAPLHFSFCAILALKFIHFGESPSLLTLEYEYSPNNAKLVMLWSQETLNIFKTLVVTFFKILLHSWSTQ